MKAGGSLSIWFFTGVCLGVNGLLILAYGIYELTNPPAEKVVLYGLHANIWWGALMFVLGAIYCWRYAPSRTNQ